MRRSSTTTVRGWRAARRASSYRRSRDETVGSGCGSAHRGERDPAEAVAAPLETRSSPPADRGKGFWCTAGRNVHRLVRCLHSCGRLVSFEPSFRKAYRWPVTAARAQAPNELPQPQVDFAFGLLKTNPLPTRFVS